MLNPLAGCTCLVIDPGPERSGMVYVYDGHFGFISSAVPVVGVMGHVASLSGIPVICETFESFGMPVGKSVFQTCYTIGRIMQVAGDRFVPMTRRTVKLHLCNSARAKDANIRQALLDRWGGKSAVGTKKNPGPLYGVKSHAWSALALAVTWWETNDDV